MPTLEQLMSEAGLAGPENELLKAQYLDALKKSRTPQPGLTESRGMYVTPAITQNIASTLEQVLGGQDSNRLMAEMAANLRKQQAFRTAGVEAATQPGADQTKMQYTFAGGGEPGLSGVANAEEKRALAQALEASRRENQRYLLEKTLASKEKLAQGDWQLKRDLDKPFDFSFNQTTGAGVGDKRTGKLTTQPLVPKPVDPNAAAAKPRVLPYGEMKDIQRLNGELESLNEIGGRFQDKYAGKGILGAAIVAGKKALGSNATPEAQEEAAYWADYQRLVDIPIRHEKFGSALTPNESAIWERARNVSPKSDPKIVRAAIASMKQIVANHLSAWKESRLEAGHRPEELTPLVKGLGGGETKAGLSDMDAKAKAWAEANPNDPRAAAIMERLKGK